MCLHPCRGRDFTAAYDGVVDNPSGVITANPYNPHRVDFALDKTYDGVVGMRVWVDPLDPLSFYGADGSFVRTADYTFVTMRLPDAVFGEWYVEFMLPVPANGFDTASISRPDFSYSGIETELKYREVQVLLTGTGGSIEADAWFLTRPALCLLLACC